MSPARRYALALLAGAALACAFPEPDIAPLAWVASAPLLIVARDVPLRRGFGLGFAFGVGFFGTLLVWISIVGWIAWFLLIVMQSCFTGGFAACWSRIGERLPRAGVFVAPALWVGFEYLRSRIPLGGFTWGQLAQSQHNVTWMLRPAAIGGAWATSFLIVLAGALLASAWTSLSARRWGSGAALVAAAAAAIAGPALLPGASATGAALDVAIVQGNVPRDFSGTLFDKEMTIISSHERLTRSLVGRGIDLVVWPESSVGLDPSRTPQAAASIERAAQGVGAPMLVGGNLDVGEDNYKVMVFEVSPKGAIVDRYQKTHLVPFGEYVPARSLLGGLPPLEQVPRDAIPGTRPKVFDVAGAPVAAVISFEGDFGSLVRKPIDLGGRLLVIATNTSTWEESWASAQHVAFGQVRAAENGVWVAHAALSGISALISPSGEVVERSGLWTATTVVGEVRLSTQPTFYARTGDWLPLGAAVVSLGALARVWLRRREVA